jgi:hypothetical protein
MHVIIGGLVDQVGGFVAFSSKKLRWFKSVTTKFVVIIVTVVLICVPALSTYLNSSYKGISSSNVNITLGDFQNFSGRPWYIFLPPIQNPVFIGVTKYVLSRYKNFGKKLIARLLVCSYFVFSSIELYIPVTITGVSNILPVYEYIANKTNVVSFEFAGETKN